MQGGRLASSLMVGFGPVRPVLRVLQQWHEHGLAAAQRAFANESRSLQGSDHPGPLMLELQHRLAGESGPRILLDGLWFCRPAGGITRVWDQILRCWQLPGLFSDQAPLLLLDRNSCLARSASFPSLEATVVDPLDWSAVAALAEENAAIARDWGANVFLSSWISTAGSAQPVCPELAFVHDCMPERSQCPDALRGLRSRWLQGASSHLAVSADTAEDLAGLLGLPSRAMTWCHPCPDPLFASTIKDSAAAGLWSRLQEHVGLRPPFVLLPATSALGSYKNPDLVLNALQHPALEPLQLVLCGVGAAQRAEEFERYAPALQGRLLSAGLSDLELALAYRHALAVLIPSRIEGFGLPVIEVMAAGGVPLIADSRGLREAGAEAAPRFDPDQPSQLVALLLLLLDEHSREWFRARLQPRVLQRLQRLHPDLLGLAMLVQARRAGDAPGFGL